MTQAEADKIAIVLGNAYGPAIWDLCCMLNEADLGFVWTIRGEEVPRFIQSLLGPGVFPKMTFAELLPGEVVVMERR